MLTRRKLIMGAVATALAGLGATPALARDERLLADIRYGVSDALVRDYIRDRYEDGRWDGHYWYYGGHRYTPHEYGRYWAEEYHRHPPKKPKKRKKPHPHHRDWDDDDDDDDRRRRRPVLPAEEVLLRRGPEVRRLHRAPRPVLPITLISESLSPTQMPTKCRRSSPTEDRRSFYCDGCTVMYFCFELFGLSGAVIRS